MKNTFVRKTLAAMLAMCMVLSLGFASAQEASADLEILEPLMDVVSAASQYSPNAPESVPGAEGALTGSFADSFLKVSAKFAPEIGVNENVLKDTNAQAELLGKIFAAKLPELSAIPSADEINGFIGFHPVSVKNEADGSGVQIIGEMYTAEKPIRSMTEADYANVELIDRAVFTFRQDPEAMNGFRLTGFNVGTDLALEQIMQVYDEEI